MQLYVLQGDWGQVHINYIDELLKNTASHLNRLLRNPFKGIIYVKPSEEGFPRVLMRDFPDQPFVIKLSARDRYWCQYAYQFSHEFCHVLSGFEYLEPERNRGPKPNNWFQEAICEVASVFTLRRMAERSATDLPCSNWVNYAEDLQNYSQELLSYPAVQLPAGLTLQAWLSLHEKELQRHRYQRDKNALVAYLLLRIFENNPLGWNAIQSLPDASGSLEEYLVDWHSALDTEDKPFVASLSQAFGYSIDA